MTAEKDLSVITIFNFIFDDVHMVRMGRVKDEEIVGETIFYIMGEREDVRRDLCIVSGVGFYGDFFEDSLCKIIS